MRAALAGKGICWFQATYVAGASGFRATVAGWAITSKMMWVALAGAFVAALLGGLACCAGVRSTRLAKHRILAAAVLIALVAVFVVHRTVTVSVNAGTSATTASKVSTRETTVNNKAKTDGDDAPAIAGGRETP